MTITISPEIERALREIATRQGTTLEDVLTQTLEKTFLAPEPQQETPEERRTRIHALMGSSRHLGPSRILEDRAEDLAREEGRWQP